VSQCISYWLKRRRTLRSTSIQLTMPCGTDCIHAHTRTRASQFSCLFSCLFFCDLCPETPSAGFVIITKSPLDVLKRNVWRGFESDWRATEIRIPGGVYGCLELIGRWDDGLRQRSSLNMTPWFDTDACKLTQQRPSDSLTLLSLYTTALIHHVS